MSDEEFDQLTVLYFEDAIDRAGLEVLNKELSNSTDRVKRFNDMRLLAGLMHEHSHDLDAEDKKLKSSGRLKIGYHLTLSAIAASLLLLIAITVGLMSEREQSALAEVPMDRSIARLKKAVKVQWQGSVVPTQGATLNPGFLEFGSGLTELEFYSGATVIIEGPARVELISPYLMYCYQGKVRARVPKEARGFTVQTPKFELVDLGTEFGLNVSSKGIADVQVFDGEVELNSTGQTVLSVKGGESVTVNNQGVFLPNNERETSYLSFDEIEFQAEADSKDKYVQWQRWNEMLREDSDVVARYDFENKTVAQGTVIGCNWTKGRWPEKGALEFRHPGDRVRVLIPGEFPKLTLMAWIRLDSLPNNRFQALLLTDEYQLDHIHWQILPKGGFGLGTGLNPGEQGVHMDTIPKVLSQQDLGVWHLFCTTYNQTEGKIRNYLNGKQVSEHDYDYGRPFKIGLGDLGNWSVPVKGTLKSRPLRNFVGAMDEVVIWSKTLSSEQIASTYTKYRP